MNAYIGTKIINAEPMSEHTFIEDVKCEQLPLSGNNRSGYCVQYPDGYMSWSPKDVFEGAYRRVSGDERNLLTGEG